jgi:hypothetical protein
MGREAIFRGEGFELGLAHFGEIAPVRRAKI